MKKDCLGRDFMTGLEVVSEKIIESKGVGNLWEEILN